MKHPKERECIMGKCCICGDIQQIDEFCEWYEAENKFYCCECISNKNKTKK